MKPLLLRQPGVPILDLYSSPLHLLRLASQSCPGVGSSPPTQLLTGLSNISQGGKTFFLREATERIQVSIPPGSADFIHVNVN